ncbi:MAG: glycosyltransferase family 2 protein, partial [Candidatus Ratteibacteria bacterium]|nr:glycosyltransferase family 2 protein [Candidatus Ratteibacteria bacterium]
GNDVVIGTRLVKESNVLRRLDREILSRGYNLGLKIVFNNKFSDAQCGFKAFSKKAVTKLMPYVKDNRWFFDTEFLIKAEHMGYKIKEVPLTWVENRNTKVKIYSTIFYFVISMFRLKKELKHLQP